MSKNKEHLARSIIIGYLSIAILAICAGIYIFNLISRIANEKEVENTAKEKIFIITNTLSLLYESEAYTQFIGSPDEDFEKFNQTLDEVHEQMQLLRDFTSDSIKLGKIDKIDELLDQKRTNTQQLLETIKEMEKIYSRNLSRPVPPTREPTKEIDVQKQEDSKQDTVVVVQRPKKGFFKRLAEAFTPGKEDSTIIVNKTDRISTDSTVNTYSDDGTTSKVLGEIQRDIAGERAQFNQRLLKQTNTLRYNNSIISNEINQLLFDIEEEEMVASEEEQLRKQELIHNASENLALIAIISIIIVLIFLFIAMRDISRSRYYRKQLEKAKQYAEDLLQSREKLMLTISHDIRAPLSSILGYLNLVKENPQKDNTMYLENIDVSAKHILSLVNDLLDFHRLDSGKMDIHPVPFKVPVLFEEIHASFKPLADAKGLSFQINIADDEDERSYLGDTVRIKQTVGNLLSNAIKFTHKGNVGMLVSIEPSNETIPNQLKIVVKDDGPGMNVEEQEKIFGEFTRLEGADKTEGFGLGLSITSKLVSLMGGTIGVKSEPEEGSEFTITLPLPFADDVISEDSDIDQKNYIQPMPPIMNNTINCLVVDDDTLQLRLTEELLKRNYIKATAITDANTVLDILKEQKFDIILTDIQMPGIDGYTLLKKIRTSGLPELEKIPIVALSASNAEDTEHYKDVGFTGFLVKPFTSGELITVLNEILSTHMIVEQVPNISSLISFAGDDKEAADSILKTFAEETEKNIFLLKEALDNIDKEQASKIAHKMLPLFTMLQSYAAVEKLHILETKYKDLTDNEWSIFVEDVIKQATLVVEKIHNKG